MSTTVTTQAELDAALAALGNDYGFIEIRSPRGVWLALRDTKNATVRASDSATVRASDSATVRASGSATVRASGSATVRASGSATVRASDSATVEASGSATVEASGSATVRASGSATVRAWDSATVRAWDSATVEASGSATVRAWDSATVEASGSATVEAWSWSKTKATPHVAVHLHSANAVVEGGVVIDVTEVNKSAENWLEHHGIEVVDGTAVLYKAVDSDLNSGRRFAYPIGRTVYAPDWSDNTECGYGLHLSPKPTDARSYFTDAKRFLACRVFVSDIRILGGGRPKVKVPSCTVLHEVDIDGGRLDTEAAS